MTRFIRLPRPHQQQCGSNIVECYKSNDSFDKVECCSTLLPFLACDNVERNFVFSTKSKQIWSTAIQLSSELKVLTLSKGRNFTINSFDNVAFLATKSNVASTLLLMWTGASEHHERTVCFSDLYARVRMIVYIVYELLASHCDPVYGLFSGGNFTRGLFIGN